MSRPDSSEYSAYFGKYITLVPEDDVLTVLAGQIEEALALLRSIPESVGNTIHPPFSWSVKQVVGHLTDCERIFGYRALRFARGDATSLPGFDENAFARIANADQTPLRDLVSEFEAVRRSHLWLFRNLPDVAWSRSGEANGNSVSVRALAYIMAGHSRHHTAILRARLTQSPS